MVKSTIHCPACGHRETAEADRAITLADVAIFRCDKCSARVVHGKLLPRVVVEPYKDPSGFVWTRHRYQDPKTKADLFVVDLDPQFAAQVATNTLSISVGT